MTLHSYSDQYWIDRQRDMIKTDRIHGLVNSTSVTDRSEITVLATCCSVGLARFGRMVQSAVVRACQKANGRRPRIPGGEVNAA